MAQNSVENLVSKLRGTDREHRKKRFDLCMEMNIQDRELRRIKSDAIRQGYPVMSTSDGAGYWLSNNPAEIARTKAELKGRALDLLTTVQALDKIPLRDQISITDIDRLVGE